MHVGRHFNSLIPSVGRRHVQHCRTASRTRSTISSAHLPSQGAEPTNTPWPKQATYLILLGNP
eukprot:5530036-Prorocentrum_lima.AAC.1